MRKMTASRGEELKYVGKAYPAWQAVEKVTGKAIFTDDLPTDLYAVILRCPHPHTSNKEYRH